MKSGPVGKNVLGVDFSSPWHSVHGVVDMQPRATPAIQVFLQFLYRHRRFARVWLLCFCRALGGHSPQQHSAGDVYRSIAGQLQARLDLCSLLLPGEPTGVPRLVAARGFLNSPGLPFPV